MSAARTFVDRLNEIFAAIAGWSYDFRWGVLAIGVGAAYGAATWQKQDGFEVGMLKDEWGKLDMPVCLSSRGLFAHREVDG